MWSYEEEFDLTPAGRIGQKIYDKALSGRSGFGDFDLDSDIWEEVFEAIGEAALEAVKEAT